MKMSRYLINEPETVFNHIAILIDAGLIISLSDNHDDTSLANDIFVTAQKYAISARDTLAENRKSNHGICQKPKTVACEDAFQELFDEE
ncbi:hypothetical protein KQL69_004901 [Escherichia coli]|nr:hypothetical protein [Escherichia coli]EFK1647149.1 hypothetical protein [Escherichia coli]EHB8334572.1 hypothetical protein [Escherichia coli]EHP9641249.1 hypothetical protein [Escherichia coli]EHP9665609.1 hypothetical protein [Escherichia coli]